MYAVVTAVNGNMQAATLGMYTGIKGQQDISCWSSMLVYGMLPKHQTGHAENQGKAPSWGENWQNMLCSINL